MIACIVIVASFLCRLLEWIDAGCDTTHLAGIGTETTTAITAFVHNHRQMVVELGQLLLHDNNTTANSSSTANHDADDGDGVGNESGCQLLHLFEELLVSQSLIGADNRWSETCGAGVVLDEIVNCEVA